MAMLSSSAEKSPQPAEGGRSEIDEALRHLEQSEKRSNRKAIEEVINPHQEAE